MPITTRIPPLFQLLRWLCRWMSGLTLAAPRCTSPDSAHHRSCAPHNVRNDNPSTRTEKVTALHSRHSPRRLLSVLVHCNRDRLIDHWHVHNARCTTRLERMHAHTPLHLRSLSLFQPVSTDWTLYMQLCHIQLVRHCSALTETTSTYPTRFRLCLSV